MLGTLSVREAIIDETKTRQISSIIAGGQLHYGMQTFDQSLLMLYKKGLITYDEALLSASNPDDFALKVKGIQSTSDMSMEADEKGSPGIKGTISGVEDGDGQRVQDRPVRGQVVNRGWWIAECGFRRKSVDEGQEYRLSFTHLPAEKPGGDRDKAS